MLCDRSDGNKQMDRIICRAKLRLYALRFTCSSATRTNRSFTSLAQWSMAH